jgi:cytochrome c oxidase subunit II
VNEFLRRILYLPGQHSTIAREIDGLHYFVILVTMAGATLVAVLAAIYLIRYRRRPGAGKDEVRKPSFGAGRDVRGHATPLWVEGGIITGLLVMFVVWWVIGYRQFVRISVPPAGQMEVYVIGKKWMWSFAYPDGRGSNYDLYVPVGRPVKLILTSRDVIHSFFVPEFRLKRDAVPGRQTVMWFEVTEPGSYQILCTEFCGVGHSTMRGRVIALPASEYEAQMELLAPLQLAGAAELAPGGAAAAERDLDLVGMGERLANTYGCLRCHTTDGAPHIGPTFARLFGSEVTLQTTETIIADEAYLTESIMDPGARITLGFPPVMPSYQGLLSAGETAAIVEYIRSLRDVPVDVRRAPDALGATPLPPPEPEEERE